MLRSLIFRTLVTNSGLVALGLVNSILLSRWLGPTGRGEVAAAMLWPTLLVYLSSMGLIASVLYFAATPDSKLQPIFANAMALAVIQGAVALIIGYVALPYLLHSQTAAVVNAGRLYLLVIPLSLSTQYGISILQGRMHMKAFNWLRTILPFGYLTGTLTLATVGHLVLLNIVILHLCLNVVAWIGTLAILLKLGMRPSFQIERDLGKQMLKYGAKVQVGNASGLANQSLDQVLMAAWLPPAYLGLYVVAVSSASLCQVFSLAVQMVSTPSITRCESQSERAAVLESVFRRYWVFSLLITLAIAGILPLAIPIVFGVNFSAAIWPAEILLLGALFVGAKEVLAGGAQALGNPWLGSKAQLLALLVTVGLLYVLLPSMGITGAAIATSAAYGTQLIMVLSGLQRSHGIPASKLLRIKPTDLRSALYIFEIAKRKRLGLLPDQS
jgi:O-antigen/teichoic acid export membrane protein